MKMKPIKREPRPKPTRLIFYLDAELKQQFKDKAYGMNLSMAELLRVLMRSIG